MTIVQNAKILRNSSTLAEVLLWNKLKNNQLGIQFYRQKPLFKKYIADFYCAKTKLIIEVDGGYHDFIFEQDSYRDEYLAQCGLTTIRFTNEEVLENIDWVIERIKKYLLY